MTNTKTFAEKVKAFLKTGDTGKINSFHSKVINIYKDNIDVLEREIKIYEEKLLEAKESKVDFLFNIDLDRLKKVDNRTTYAQEFAEHLALYTDDEDYKEMIKNNKDKIKKFKALIKYMEETEPIIEK